VLNSRQFSYKISFYEHGDGRSWEIYRWHLSVGPQKSESNRILGVTILKSQPGVFWICPYSWMPTLCPNSGSVLSPRTRTVYFVLSATISEFNGNLLVFSPTGLVSVRFASSFSKLLSLRAYKSLVSRLIVCVGFAASINQLPPLRAFKSLVFFISYRHYGRSTPWFLSYNSLWNSLVSQLPFSAGVQDSVSRRTVLCAQASKSLGVCLLAFNSVLSLIVSVCLQGRTFSYRLLCAYNSLVSRFLFLLALKFCYMDCKS